jgi:hypothetical protein
MKWVKKMKINKKIKVLYVILITFLFIFVTALHLMHPEWFIFQQSSHIRTEAELFTETKLKQIPPYESCDYNNKCEWKNIPYDEPYITQTGFAWVYTYQWILILVTIITGVIANNEEIRKWITTHSN